MKNPFKQEDNSGLLIGTLILTAAAVGTATYYYVKRRRELAEAAAQLKEHATDYLKEKAKKAKKKQKTDVHELQNLVKH